MNETITKEEQKTILDLISFARANVETLNLQQTQWSGQPFTIDTIDEVGCKLINLFTAE
jgi:hypothetical protein